MLLTRRIKLELCKASFERSRNALLYTHLYKACSQHRDVELKHEKQVMRNVFHVNFGHSHTVVAAQTNTYRLLLILTRARITSFALYASSGYMRVSFPPRALIFFAMITVQQHVAAKP